MALCYEDDVMGVKGSMPGVLYEELDCGWLWLRVCDMALNWVDYKLPPPPTEAGIRVPTSFFCPGD
jgi:hypothetical protein